MASASSAVHPRVPATDPAHAAAARRSERRHPTGEQTQQSVIEDYERQGFTGQFGARSGGQVMCFKCRAEHPANRMHVVAMHRLEGSSDPGDEMAIAALTCPTCGQKGTLSLSYGVTASIEDRLVLQALSDHRGQTGIHPGV